MVILTLKLVQGDIIYFRIHTLQLVAVLYYCVNDVVIACLAGEC